MVLIGEGIQLTVDPKPQLKKRSRERSHQEGLSTDSHVDRAGNRLFPVEVVEKLPRYGIIRPLKM